MVDAVDHVLLLLGEDHAAVEPGDASLPVAPFFLVAGHLLRVETDAEERKKLSRLLPRC